MTSFMEQGSGLQEHKLRNETKYNPLTPVALLQVKFEPELPPVLSCDWEEC